MKRPLFLLAVTGIVTACSSDVNPTAPPSAPNLATTAAQTYQFFAHAVAVQIDPAIGPTINISEAGPVPTSGDQEANSFATYSASGITASALNASVDAVPGPSRNSTSSFARSQLLKVTIIHGANVITASYVASIAVARCENDDELDSWLQQVTVNGQSVFVRGTPNQTVPLVLGTLIINEQIRTPAGSTVNALHLKVAGLADLILAHSFANLVC